MAVTLTQFTGITGTGTLSKAFTSAVNVGDLIVVAITNNVGQTTVPSDGVNTYTQLNTSSITPFQSLFYAIATTAATLTISCASLSFATMGIASFNAGGGTFSLDGSAVTNTGTSTAPSCGSTGNAGDLVVGTIAWRTSASTLTSTFSIAYNQAAAAGVNDGGGTIYQIGATGATNLGGTLSASQFWTAAAQAFRVTGGGGSSAALASSPAGDALASSITVKTTGTLAHTAAADAFAAGTANAAAAALSHVTANDVLGAVAGPAAPMVFNLTGDASLVELFDDQCTLAINSDGSGGAPSSGGTCGYIGGLKGLANAVANVSGTAITGLTLNRTYNGNTRASFVSNGTNALSIGGGAATITGLTDSGCLGSSTCSILIAVKQTGTWGSFLSKCTSGTTVARLNFAPGFASYQSSPANLYAELGLNNTAFDNRFHTYGYGWDFTTQQMQHSYFDGCGTFGGNGALTAADTTHPVMICGEWSGTAVTDGVTGEVFFIAFYSRLLEPWEWKSADDQLRTMYGLPLAHTGTPAFIVLDADSLHSIGGPANGSYPDGLNQMLGLPSLASNNISTFPYSGFSSGAFFNCGWGGKTVSQMNTFAGVTTDPLFEYLATTYPSIPLIYTMAGITNDLVTGSTVVQACEAVIANCLGRKAVAANNGHAIAGTVIVDLLDRSTISVPEKQQVNQFLYSTYPAYASAILNRSTHPYTANIFTDYCSLNGDLQADHVHYILPYPAVYSLAALANVIRGVIATVATLPTATAISLTDAVSSMNSSSAWNTPGNRLTPMWLMANGTYTGAVTLQSQISGSNVTDDVWSSPDPRFAAGTNGACTVTFGGTADGVLVILKAGAETANRSVVVTPAGLSSSTRSIKMFSLAATQLFLTGPVTGTSPMTFPFAPGVAATPLQFHVRLIPSQGTNDTGNLTGGTLPVTAATTNGTVAWNSSGTAVSTFSTSMSEDWFTWTPTTNASTTISVSASGLTQNPSVFPAIVPYSNTTPTITITQPPLVTGHNNMYPVWATVISVQGLTSGSLQVTMIDAAGGTLLPNASPTFTPLVINAPVYIAKPVSVGTHAITFTNTGSLTNPSTFNITVAAFPYALTGTTPINAGTPDTLTITPGATIGADLVTLSGGGAGAGLVNPDNLFAGSSSAETATYTQGTPGTYTVTATSAFGVAITGSPFSVTVSTPSGSSTFAHTAAGDTLAASVTSVGGTDTAVLAHSASGDIFAALTHLGTSLVLPAHGDVFASSVGFQSIAILSALPAGDIFSAFANSAGSSATATIATFCSSDLFVGLTGIQSGPTPFGATDPDLATLVNL